jgi:hypothetical protein
MEVRRDLRPQTTARPDSRLIHPMTLLTQQRKVDRSTFDADATALSPVSTVSHNGDQQMPHLSQNTTMSLSGARCPECHPSSHDGSASRLLEALSITNRGRSCLTCERARPHRLALALPLGTDESSQSLPEVGDIPYSNKQLTHAASCCTSVYFKIHKRWLGASGSNHNGHFT